MIGLKREIFIRIFFRFLPDFSTQSNQLNFTPPIFSLDFSNKDFKILVKILAENIWDEISGGFRSAKKSGENHCIKSR